MCSHNDVIWNCSQRGVYSHPTIPSVLHRNCHLICTPSLFSPLWTPPAPAATTTNPIVLVLSVSYVQILMSPQSFSAFAAFACHLPGCKDTQVAIIPCFSSLWLIARPLRAFLTSPFYFLIFPNHFEKKKKFILTFSLVGNLPPLCYLLSLLCRRCCLNSKVFFFFFFFSDLQHSVTSFYFECACTHFAFNWSETFSSRSSESKPLGT